MSIYINDRKIGDGETGGIYNGSTKIGMISKGSQIIYMVKKSETITPTGELYTYVVPKYAHKLHIDCVASKGANGSASGGNGGRVECDLMVTPGQILYITTGKIPSSYSSASYNASDIRIGGTEYANRVIVAGGGGSGASAHGSGAGGAGGGTTGGSGETHRCCGGGSGGSQTGGGSGGVGIAWTSQQTRNGSAGTLGMGGAPGSHSGVGGAGGAGYYGGGGGAGGFTKSYGTYGGGGAGGSSYTDANLCTNVVHTQGYQNGEGYVSLTVIG